MNLSDFHHIATRVRYRAKHWLGRRPRLYNWTYRLRDGYADRLVTDATDVCIEGFPRSANSFAVGAFEYAQDEALSIAHHNHVPAPVLNAVRRDLPTIVLIRYPVDAVVSFRALQLQNSARSDTPSSLLAISCRLHLQTWIAFYECITPILSKVVVAPFEVVTNNFDRVIHALNDRFGTTFAPFDHTKRNVESVRDTRGYHALPSEQREALKEQAREEFTTEIGDDHPLLERATRLHRNCVEEAEMIHPERG